MCGISGIVGRGWTPDQLEAMIASQRHRGPDMEGRYFDPHGIAAFALNRLSIIDLSDAGRQPMTDPESGLTITLNGEIYNYLELRNELHDYPYRSKTDTEVVLAAYKKWGEACLDRLIGMFAFMIWDERKQRLFGARDRFGVKPFHYYFRDGGPLLIASEIETLFAGGAPRAANASTWATYFVDGLHDHSENTFWQHIYSLAPGHSLTWEKGRISAKCWYDLAERVGCGYDERPIETVREEYLAILKDSVKLRFRSDVPVGINLSGGLDSSILLALVQNLQGEDSNMEAFTYVTGNPDYDELPWVKLMLEGTQHPSVVYQLNPAEVPALAESVQRHESEPFGGMPTLAYARLFERARANGVTVVMDGQGMDEQWAGYDYYANASNGNHASPIQGTKQRTTRPECLTPEFRSLAQPFVAPTPFPDALRNRQYADTRYTKIPKALRFNDRISMRASIELREPFLDHRLFELAFKQPRERKIENGTRKKMLREVARELIVRSVVEAPKRPVQTPQREWLRGPLMGWAEDCIESALLIHGESWLDSASIRSQWQAYCNGECDNSFHVWQWISLGLACKHYYQSTRTVPSSNAA
jgi:asparagine synthase (glutamine-hydrolysing)